VDFVVPARANAARLMPIYFANYSQKQASAVRALRVARGSLLLTTGTASRGAWPTHRRLTSPPSSNGALSTRAALVAINRNSWSRSVGMSGRDRRNAGGFK